MRLLLDTHILLWWLSDRTRLSPTQQQSLDEAVAANTPVFVHDISLWEIALLTEHRHIALSLPLRDWLEMAVAPPRVQRYGITPAIAAQVAALPVQFHRDPADRILVSTAIVMGLHLVTSDRRVIDSALVPTIS